MASDYDVHVKLCQQQIIKLDLQINAVIQVRGEINIFCLNDYICFVVIEKVSNPVNKGRGHYLDSINQ